MSACLDCGGPLCSFMFPVCAAVLCPICGAEALDGIVKAVALVREGLLESQPHPASDEDYCKTQAVRVAERTLTPVESMKRRRTSPDLYDPLAVDKERGGWPFH